MPIRYLFKHQNKDMVSNFRFFLLSCTLLLSCGLSGQNSDAPKMISGAHFLKNCTLVSQPGNTLKGNNVLIRNGLITDIGTHIVPPFDALVINCDSLFVYAGFIDPYSHTGIIKPENKERSRVQDPGNPPNETAGITPEVNTSTLFNPGEKSVEEMRTSGFCISQTVPYGLMLPGQNSLFLLGDGPADKLLIKSGSGQNFQLEVSRGVYPSTIIGAMAKFRDLYKNASLGLSYEEKYRLNPAGMPRPEQSREIKALYPVVSKSVPLYFLSQYTKDVHKALALKSELGFDMVLAEVKQGWHYADKLKSQNIPVLLSLSLPEEIKKDSTAKSGETAAEKEGFDKKREESYKQYLTQASQFENLGIRFAFSYKNVNRSDILKNIRTLIKNGLSENYALAALTTHPAQILGISGIAGSVEKGKMANIVVTDKPIFDEKSKIKYVFVEGRKYEMAEKPKKQDGGKDRQDPLAGSWSYVVDTPDMAQKGRITITKSEAGGYKVVVKDETNSATEYEGKNVTAVDKNQLSFYIDTDLAGPLKVDFNLTFETSGFSGAVIAGQLGSFNVKGEKLGKPEKLNH